MFDQEANVEEGFFGCHKLETRSFQGSGTSRLPLPPLIKIIDVAMRYVHHIGHYYSILPAVMYDGKYLKLKNTTLSVERTNRIQTWTHVVFPEFAFRRIFGQNCLYDVTADFGYEKVPADIRGAVKNYALTAFLRNDLSDYDIRGREDNESLGRARSQMLTTAANWRRNLSYKSTGIG
jgi:hypothetical protein